MIRRPTAAERELKLQLDLMTEQRQAYDEQASRATLKADLLNEQISILAQRIKNLQDERSKLKKKE